MGTLLTLFLCGYGLLIAGMYLFQRRLMYHPDKRINAPQTYGLAGFEEVSLTTPDRLRLQCWYRPAAAGFPTIAYFHGNAGHVGHRAPLFAALADKGFGVLALGYRGYGNSQGFPSEAGLYIDARAALQFLTETQGLSLNRIMLFGESLGTGVAVHIASEVAVAALILQAPYTSVVGRAAEMYRYIPVRLLVHDRYDSINKIAQVKAPLLLFHGELDTVIPIAHARTLFEAANQPKQSFFFAGGAHNNFDSAVISAHVLDFAKHHQLIES